MNHPIALLTDFGTRDAYVAQLRGSILRTLPGAQIVDLSHEMHAFDIRRAALFLDKAVRTYPPGTIVVAVVDPGVGGPRLPVALRTQSGRTYIGPDNGLFSAVVTREKLAEAREITNTELFSPSGVSPTFHGRDIFAPVAARLAGGFPLEDVGPVLKKLLILPLPVAAAVGDKVTGEVTFVDTFGNILTNIESSHLERLEKDALVKVTLGNRTMSLPLVPTYASAPDKRPFLLLNSDGELEIAVREGSAAAALKAEPGQRIVVQR